VKNLLKGNNLMSHELFVFLWEAILLEGSIYANLMGEFWY